MSFTAPSFTTNCAGTTLLPTAINDTTSGTRQSVPSGVSLTNGVVTFLLTDVALLGTRQFTLSVSSPQAKSYAFSIEIKCKINSITAGTLPSPTLTAGGAATLVQINATIDPMVCQIPLSYYLFDNVGSVPMTIYYDFFPNETGQFIM